MSGRRRAGVLEPEFGAEEEGVEEGGPAANGDGVGCRLGFAWDGVGRERFRPTAGRLGRVGIFCSLRIRPLWMARLLVYDLDFLCGGKPMMVAVPQHHEIRVTTPDFGATRRRQMRRKYRKKKKYMGFGSEQYVLLNIVCLQKLPFSGADGRLVEGILG